MTSTISADPAALPNPFPPEAEPDPYPLFTRLRREAPVHPVPLPDGRRLWLVTRHDDVEAALRDPRDVLPAADLVELPGLGHAVPLEDPAAVADLIRTTVARVAAPAAA